MAQYELELQKIPGIFEQKQATSWKNTPGTSLVPSGFFARVTIARLGNWSSIHPSLHIHRLDHCDVTNT